MESVVANMLNTYLGKYIRNLDSDNVSVGLFRGKVELTDLQLKPEALYELDLPIEVKSGYVGKISIDVPLISLFSSPVECVVEDVYVLAGPVLDRKYDPDRERALLQASKRKKLEELERSQVTPDGDEGTGNQGFMERLQATIVNNIQVSIQRIHIRYEDKVTNPDHPFACGFMLKLLTAETTNNQWIPAQTDAKASLIHKLIRMQGLSVYWNPYLPEQSLVGGRLHSSAWRNLLKNSINTHRILEDELDFILKPISASAKLMFNKDSTSNMPKLLADFSMDEIEMLVSRQQFLNMLGLYDSFQMMTVNQHYRKYSPGLPVKGHAAAWWHYAYTAVVEEVIRPYSWKRIKQHRQTYKQYKMLYKQLLGHQDDVNLKAQLRVLEEKLDVANIVIAREHAKLEFAKSATTTVAREEPKSSWWSWMWGGGDEDEEEEDEEELKEVEEEERAVVVSLPNWLSSLTPEEKEKLFKDIGYSGKEGDEHDTQYVAQKINFNLVCCSVSLVNYGKEVLKVSVTQLCSSFENRPDSDGFRTTMKTESFVVEGVSIEHELVPLITSDIGVYAPSILTQVFSFEFEMNPVHIEADFAARLNIQPVEIVYDEHAVTEVIAFFQVPNLSAGDVRTMAAAGFSRIATFSRLGLQYAIQQHKTLHLSVNMRSPYVVIPEYGTLHRGGNVVVVDFGKLKVESALQPKHVNLEDCTVSEIETQLYDRFNITVTDVKALLADSGDDWHTAQTKPESEFHLLPSVGMQIAFFNTVQPSFRQRPKHKIEAKLSTLKLNLSDEKILMLSDFFKHVPVPRSNSMMGLDDSVDGHIDPAPIPMMVPAEVQWRPTVIDLRTVLKSLKIAASVIREVKLDPSPHQLLNIRRSVYRNSVVRRRKKRKRDVTDFSTRGSRHSRGLSSDSDRYYSASDHSDEELDDWARGFDLPAIDDATSASNLVTVLGRFKLGEVVVQLSKSADKIDTPYLMFRVDRVCADAAVTVHGLAMQASLGGIQLVDKIHLGSSGEYLELLSSKTDADLISFKYRKVEPSCPEFDSVYRNIEQGLVIQLSSLKVTFDRVAILYLNTFVQGLLINVHGGMESGLHRSTSTIMSGPNAEAPHPDPPSFIERLTSQGEVIAGNVVQLTLVAQLDDLELRLCDHENDFADISIKGLVGKIVMKAKRTTIHARLSDLLIEDLTENTLYPRVLTIEDDNAFDMKMVSYSENHRKLGAEKMMAVDGSLKLRIGRMHGVFLYKFISEMKNFLEPFTNPELVESYKVAAQQAVHSKIQDVQDQGTRISLYLDVRAPTILVPQHSESTNVMLVKFGDLSLKNFFEDSEVGSGVLQHWDHMYLSLDAVQVLRGKLNLNGNVEPIHNVVEPINLKIDLKRALPPHRTDLHYDLCGDLHRIKVHLTEPDMKVLMAIIRDNLNEISNKPAKVDEADLTPMSDRPILLIEESVEMTTPVVEIEEPLLSAPEVMELVRQTKFTLSMEGVELNLLMEEDDPLAAPPSLETEGGEGFCQFEVGKLLVGGLVNNDGSLEVQLTLQSLLMKDIRENSNLAVRRLIHSTLVPEKSTDTLPMVDIVYRLSPEGNKQVDINIETLRLNVCVPYLLTVTQFFTKALQTLEDSHSMPSPTATTRQDSRRGGNNPPYHARPATLHGHGQPPADPLAAQAVTLTGRWRQLEVVLFAQPTQRRSRVIVLKANGTLDYLCLKDREHLEARVKQLQIVSCLYGQAKQTASMVLYPCDVELTRTKDSADSPPLKMAAKLSDVRLHVSATTVHIVQDVVEIINNSKPAAVTTHDEVLGSAQHYDLWTVKNISSEPWLQPEVEDPASKKYPLHPVGAPLETLHVGMAKLQVVFEVENLDYRVPRLCITTALEADLHDWSHQLRAQGEFRLEVNYFNEKLAVWEPLVEPVMEEEGNYRPWEVLVKLVRAQSHPISCNELDFNIDRDDDVDGEVHFMMSRARSKRSDSSETDTDSETEMTIIKPKPHRKMRHGSHSSYDSVGHHSSIQGESDSDPELISTISSNLDSMFSSDSSEGDLSEEGEDDAFESLDKPVFLTSKGPIHVETEKESGYDEVDFGEEEAVNLCSYLLIDSHDSLQLNVTPHAMDVITEVIETLTRKDSSTLKSVHDLPGFEIFNQLEIPAKVSLSPELKDVEVDKHWTQGHGDPLIVFAQPSTSLTEVFEDDLHDVQLLSGPARGRDVVDAKELDTEEEEDEVDGLSFLSKALGSTGHALLTPVGFLVGPEEDEEGYHSNNKELKKERMHIKIDGFDDLYNISHKKAVSRLIPLTPCKNDTNYCVVYEVTVIHGRRVVTVRSPLQLHNQLTVPIEVYCRTEELARYSSSSSISSSSSNRAVRQADYIRLATLQPGQLYHVPLYVAYHCRLYVAPAEIGYEKSDSALWWQDLSVIRDRHKFFSCQAKHLENKPFYFKTVCEEGKQCQNSACLPRGIPSYCLHLYPPVVVHNFLPYDIQFSLENCNASALMHGENAPLYTADLTKNPKLQLQVSDYLGVDWYGSVDLTSDLEEFKAVTMESEVNVEGLNKQLSFGLHVNRTPTLDLYVYSPYWIINKTELPVHIRGSRSEAVYSNEISQDPLLFRFKKHRRKKAKLKVYNSKWTRSFSLDTIGSNGVVVCHDKERNKKYQFLLQIQMSKLKLTKLVTIMPYFLVLNKTSHPLRYMEDNEQADLWMDIQPHACIPFWPATDSMKMYVKYKDSSLTSQRFLIHRSHITTLRMDKGTALCVDVSGGTETAVTITFMPYEHGDAPVRINNLCEDVFLKLHQKKQSQVSLLSPNQSVLYTWDDPTSERTLMWNVYNRKKPSYPAFIAKDGHGEVQLGIQTVKSGMVLPTNNNTTAANTTNSPKPESLVTTATAAPTSHQHHPRPHRHRHRHPDHPGQESSPDDDSDSDAAPAHSPLLHNTRTDKVVVYWVSFLDGLQRVLLFTQDQRVARRARKGFHPATAYGDPQINEAEQASLALFLSLGGITASLVNAAYEEVALVSLSSGAPMWEVEVKNKWKPLNMELASWLEEKWLKDESTVLLEDFMEADLDKMEMKKPFMGAIRRVYNPALWVQYRSSEHHTYLHTKIHRLQIDNQLRDAYFPTVFYPAPIPAYIQRKTGTKPFVEMVVMRRQVPQNHIDTVKYAKLLIQEFNLKLDKGFIMSVYDVFAAKQSDKVESEQLQADLTQIHRTLHDLAAIQAATRPQRLLFEYLHLSPLKMRVSFSVDGKVHAVNQPKSDSLTSDVVDFFLKSVGATLTEFTEVELKMAFFERQGVLLSVGQLMAQVQSHYTSQAVQQAYVLLLGLDVLGNPYGLIKDFTQGLGDFFYEPFMSTIQGPDKFTENLVVGVQSLMTHTVGSCAGSVSLVTGSLGKALASLSFDEDYKKRRRVRLQQHPKNLPSSLFNAGKGFIMGVVLGLSGVVVSPVRGVQEEGVEGFFKGVGKGLMGLLTKPAGGAVDMVSMAFDGLRRAAEMGEDVLVRMRPPRYINRELGVKPYSRYQAVGMRILNSINRGAYADSDIYWAHASLSRDDRADVAVITNKRILLLEKCKLWGDWDLEWDTPLCDIITVPGISNDRLILKVRRDDTGLSIFTSDQREIPCADPEVLLWLQKKYEQVVALNNQ